MADRLKKKLILTLRRRQRWYSLAGQTALHMRSLDNDAGTTPKHNTQGGKLCEFQPTTLYNNFDLLENTCFANV